MNVLFLSGQHEHMGQLVSLAYCQVDFSSILKREGWNVFHADIYAEEDVKTAYATIEGPLLVVYTGHGEGRVDSPYPLIYPFNHVFDLLSPELVSLRKQQPTSYIFDCCNVCANGELKKPLQLGGGDVAIRFYTACLNPRQCYVIAMQQGNVGVTRRRGTFLTHAMGKVMLNVECLDIETFSRVLVPVCLKVYKTENQGLYLKKKSVRHVTTHNGTRPPCDVRENQVSGFVDPAAVYIPVGFKPSGTSIFTRDPPKTMQGVLGMPSSLGSSSLTSDDVEETDDEPGEGVTLAALGLTLKFPPQ